MKKVFADALKKQMNVTVAFRCKRASFGNYTPVLKVVASNVFRVFIDGVLVGYGPRRSAHGFSILDKYELKDCVNREFCITVEVASYRCGGYYIVDEAAFFACEVFCGGQKLCDSEDFEAYLLSDRVQRVQRYSYQRTFTESYVMENNRTDFYLNKATDFEKLQTATVEGNEIISSDLSYPKYIKIAIDKLIEKGTIFEREKPFEYKDRTISGISETFLGFKTEELQSFLSQEVGKIGFQRSDKTHNESIIEDGYCLFDLNYNTSSFIGSQIKTISDSEIYFIFDEILCDEELYKKGDATWVDKNALPLAFHRLQCCNIIKYKLKGGKTYDLLSFEPYTFRWLKIVVKGKISLEKLYHIPYESSATDKTKFHSADDRLNSIFEAALNTFKQNAVDILTDCPSRERAGWLCDSYFTGRAEQLLTGSNAVEKNTLLAYLLSPQSKHLPSGMLPMCYPADHFDGVYIPNWAMFYVIELYDYLKRSGDFELINKSKDRVYKLFEFLEGYKNDFGLLEKLDSWIFVEWSKSAEFVRDVSFPTNMLYYNALCCAFSLYNDKKFINRANEIKDAICRLSFNGEFFEDNAVYENGELRLKGNITETCQYYAFYFGIADKKSHKSLYEKMFTEFGPKRDAERVYKNVYRSNAFIGNFLRLDYLKREGRIEQVYEECFDYFSYMAERTGTLWEHDKPHASCNHGFASYVATFILEAVAGYKGFDKIERKVFFTKPKIQLDFNALLPIENSFVEIKSTNGKREIVLPLNYSQVDC